ncbi:MAG: enoyl-CoA hydratase/isomerase family protein [Hyphomicrobiales bacterium]|nr:enoyl-CoA hydratase/isomerase family protein [Hyphomicrobiales bacterium]
MTAYKDITADVEGHVQVVTIRRPPFNYFDNALIRELAAAFETADKDKNIRVSVLAAEGKAFCAGADLVNRSDTGTVAEGGKHLYKEAARLFRAEKPIIAAVHGAAIGGGLGLAVMADFRVTCAEARFSANFARLGMHPGFGLTTTLPRLVGQQKAAMLFYTGRRISGEEAHEIGLADVLVPEGQVLKAAKDLAAEIAHSAPLAVLSIRETLRRGLADAVETATERELVEQDWQRRTEDFKEGVKATAERRLPKFFGK